MENSFNALIAARWKRAAIAQPAPWAVSELQFLTQVIELVREKNRCEKQAANVATIQANATDAAQNLIDTRHSACEICIRGAAVFSLIRLCPLPDKKLLLSNLYKNLNYDACTIADTRNFPAATPAIFDYRNLTDYIEYLRERPQATNT